MTRSQPRILCLSAYDAQSHRIWRGQLPGLVPEAEWHQLALPPRYFRWRIRGNPLSWFGLPELEQQWDLLVATSMVDLASLRGINPALARVPAVAYFHENQFAYPDRPGKNHSLEPGMVNLYTALAADRVLFNSHWNRDSFMAGVERLMHRLPDHVPARLRQTLEGRSEVLPVPVPDALFNARPRKPGAVPHLVWNHRWEYDKGPDRLVALLEALERRGRDYRLSLVGQQFRERPAAFDRIEARHGAHLVHFGYVEERQAYRSLLGAADLVLSTALHDFQGLAVLEAMAAGCRPLVPDRLAYPDYVPEPFRYASFPDDLHKEAEAAADTLERLLAAPPPPPDISSYRASALTPAYQRLMLPPQHGQG